MDSWPAISYKLRRSPALPSPVTSSAHASGGDLVHLVQVGSISDANTCPRGDILYWIVVREITDRSVRPAVYRSILHRCIAYRSVSSKFLFQWEIRSGGKPVTL